MRIDWEEKLKSNTGIKIEDGYYLNTGWGKDVTYQEAFDGFENNGIVLYEGADPKLLEKDHVYIIHKRLVNEWYQYKIEMRNNKINKIMENNV